jgi:hypothetical protein
VRLLGRAAVIQGQVIVCLIAAADETIGTPGYNLTVVPVKLGFFDRPLAMLLAIVQFSHTSSIPLVGLEARPFLVLIRSEQLPDGFLDLFGPALAVN